MKILRFILLVGLPILSIGLITFSMLESRSRIPDKKLLPPPNSPPVSPFGHRVAGLGVIEPQSRVIAVGTDVAGTVASVNVKPGDRVTRGQLLFEIESSLLRSSVEVSRAGVEASTAAEQVAQADILSAEAGLAVRQRELENSRSLLALLDAVSDPRALRIEDLTTRRNSVATAAVRIQEAISTVRAAKARRDQSQSQLVEARTRLLEAEARLGKTRIVALQDASVLAVDIRPGEFAAAGVLSTPLIRLGDVTTLHVRVSFDEELAGLIPDSPDGVAYSRGNTSDAIILRPVLREPLSREKQNVAGGRNELIDTRVMQYVFVIESTTQTLWVGQQLDVFINTQAAAASTQKESR